MPDPPDLATLLAGCAGEARALAADATGGTRQRLLVLAHTLALAERELRAPAAVDPGGGDAALAAAIRAGAHDEDLVALVARLRPGVARRLEIANPGYGAD